MWIAPTRRLANGLGETTGARSHGRVTRATSVGNGFISTGMHIASEQTSSMASQPVVLTNAPSMGVKPTSRGGAQGKTSPKHNLPQSLTTLMRSRAVAAADIAIPAAVAGMQTSKLPYMVYNNGRLSTASTGTADNTRWRLGIVVTSPGPIIARTTMNKADLRVRSIHGWNAYSIITMV